MLEMCILWFVFRVNDGDRAGYKGCVRECAICISVLENGAITLKAVANT